MAKIDVDTLKFILTRNIGEPEKVSTIMQAVKDELQVLEEDKGERPPPVKKQFGIIIADNDGVLRGKNMVGWIVQLPEEDSVLSGTERIIRAAYEFNATPNGRRLPVQTIGEACESVSAKLLKAQNVWVKTKVPVLVVATPNAIPREPAVK